MTGPSSPAADLAVVTDAYASWAPAYIEAFGTAEQAPDEDRELIAEWSGHLVGPVLDAGCGPGHWSGFLSARGIAVEGVDATPAFVEHARRTRPGIPFRRGDLRDLGLETGSLGGVLAWFSLIHTDPDEVPAVLAAFADALAPGGSVLLGFFTGDELAPFEHRVVTAWAWPLHRMVAAAELAGLEVVHRRSRTAPNGRVLADLIARVPTTIPRARIR